MNKLILILFLPLLLLNKEPQPIVKGCEDNKNPEKCSRKIINEHIRKNFNCETNITGQIIVNFTIDTLGNINNTKVLKGLNNKVDSCIISSVETLPKMNPYIINDNKVTLICKLPINLCEF
jgi:hypothetical protein